MALDMRALYYVALPEAGQDEARYREDIKSNENAMNQNFTILVQKIEELEARLSALE